MRKTLVFVALLVLALPVAGLAGLQAGEGTLTVENGRGLLSLTARGGVIGRLDRGSVTVYDFTPDDANQPAVFGDDRPIVFVGESGIRYSGAGLRFRITGGRYKIVVEGRGIDVSAVGKGTGLIVGDGDSPGLYSLEGDDCRKTPARCKPLPSFRERFQLGARADG